MFEVSNILCNDLMNVVFDYAYGSHKDKAKEHKNECLKELKTINEYLSERRYKKRKISYECNYMYDSKDKTKVLAKPSYIKNVCDTKFSIEKNYYVHRYDFDINYLPYSCEVCNNMYVCSKHSCMKCESLYGMCLCCKKCKNSKCTHSIKKPTRYNLNLRIKINLKSRGYEHDYFNIEHDIHDIDIAHNPINMYCPIKSTLDPTHPMYGMKCTITMNGASYNDLMDRYNEDTQYKADHNKNN